MYEIITIPQADNGLRLLAVSPADARAVRRDPAQIECVTVLGSLDVDVDGNLSCLVGPQGRSRPKGIDWDALPLGIVSDHEIARRLGVSQPAVSAARRKRGIPPAPVRPGTKPAIDWDALPLGRVPDREIAEEYGVSHKAVAEARRRRGLAAEWAQRASCSAKPKAPRRRRIDWSAQPLGQISDLEIARRLGCAVSAVWSARRRLAIPVAPRRHAERNATIVAAHVAGESLSAIARRYGLTRQRVQQIVRSARSRNPTQPNPTQRRHPKMATRHIDVIVTRHPALVDYLRELGVADDATPVKSHVSADDVRGRHVCGVLPLHLAAEAASVTEIPLALTPGDRGLELSIERIREIAGPPRTYFVRAQDQELD